MLLPWQPKLLPKIRLQKVFALIYLTPTPKNKQYILENIIRSSNLLVKQPYKLH